jgi:glycosyltransferase involved in cell wall biosynthesis
LSDLPRLLLCSFDVIPGPSGSSRRLTEYLKALPDRFNVVVLSAKTPDHSHIEKYQGARLLRVPVGAGDLVSRIQAFERAVRRQLESEEYALAHFTDPFGGYVLCEQKGDYGYRLIYEAQTFPSQELRYTHPLTEGDKRFLAKVRRQELFCLMNADLVVTGSEITRSYIQSLGASTEQIRIVRAPADLEPYKPDVLGAPDGQPMRLMYLGSQAGWQGLPTLLRALVIVVERGLDVKLTLVGAKHPDWQPHLEELTRELGLKQHVEFQPPVLHDDLAKVLALADVGMLPLDDVDRNRLQGGPLAKVSEYLAAGRPVIAADLPVTRELIPDTVALFHPPGDSQALADRIIELARDVARRVELGKEARAFAEQELDAGLIRGQVLDLYDEMLGRQSVVGTPSEMPMPTMTGTPTNRLAQIAPPDGRRSSKPSAPPSEDAAEPVAPADPWADRSKPPVEDLPLVIGQVLENGLDTRLIKTEPDMRPTDPPVVMGLPLREGPRASNPNLPYEEPPAPTPIIKLPTALQDQEPVAPEPPTKPRSSKAPKTPKTPRVRKEPVASKARRKESDDGPTSLVRAPSAPPPEERSEPSVASGPVPDAPRSETPVPPEPTPIVRAPVEALDEAVKPSAPAPVPAGPGEPPEPPVIAREPSTAPEPPARAEEPSIATEPPARSPVEARSEEPPEPTPITPAKTIAAESASADSRQEPATASQPPPPAPVPPAGAAEDKPSEPAHAREPSTPAEPPARAPIPARSEQPPEPTPITPAKTIAEEVRPPEVPAPEPASSRPALPAPASPAGAAVGVPSEPARAQEPSTASVSSPPQEPVRTQEVSPVSARSPLQESARPRSSVSQELPRLQEDPEKSRPELAPTPPPLPSRFTPASGTNIPAVLTPSAAPAAGTKTLPPIINSSATPAAGTRTLPPIINSSAAPAAGTKTLPPIINSSATPAAGTKTLPPIINSSGTPPSGTKTPSGYTPVATPLPRAAAPASRVATEDEPEEISEEEALEIPEEAGLEAAPTPPHPRLRLDEPEEISSDEVEEAGEAEAVEAAAEPIDEAEAVQVADADPIEADSSIVQEAPDAPIPQPPDSALDPWFAQLAHGYCPPEGAQFARHTPPTTFPGRDEEPTDPSRVPPSPRAQGAPGGKSS